MNIASGPTNSESYNMQLGSKKKSIQFQTNHQNPKHQILQPIITDFILTHSYINDIS